MVEQDKDRLLKDLQTIDETIRVEDADDSERRRGVWRAALVLDGPRKLIKEEIIKKNLLICQTFVFLLY